MLLPWVTESFINHIHNYKNMGWCTFQTRCTLPRLYCCLVPLQANKPVESPPLGFPLVRPVPQPTPESTATQPRPQPTYGKGVRFKGKRAYPTVPNQPSEASAYFMFELAKTVLNRAGGNSSTSLFTQVSITTLTMCTETGSNHPQMKGNKRLHIIHRSHITFLGLLYK